MLNSGNYPLRPKKLEVLQINVGYMCNQVCEHCHVDAGPDRKEIMTRETNVSMFGMIRNTGAHTLDLTGGAPEMNPDFRWFVQEAAKAGIKDFMVGFNLTLFWQTKNTTIYRNFSKNTMYRLSHLCHTIQGAKQISKEGKVFLINRLRHYRN